MTQEINDAYIRERFGMDLPQDNIDNIRTAMQKYESNHWWESDNIMEIAFYQLFEDILLTKFSLVLEGLEKICGRPILDYEFAINLEGLREEVRIEVENLEKGYGLSEIVSKRREIDSLRMLADYCEKHNKKLFSIGK